MVTKGGIFMKKLDLKKINFKSLAMDALVVGTGIAIAAFAITSILKPNGLVMGGITGTSLLVEKMTGVNYTYIYFALSICVLLSTFFLLGKREALKIIVLSLLFPPVLILFSQRPFNFVQGDMMLAAIYFGLINGIGCGLILKRGFSSGGTDSIAKILHAKLFPFISLSQILLTIDTVIITASAFVFDRNVALYAILTQVVFMKTLDVVMFGIGNKLVKIEVISTQYEEISRYILKEIKRGVSMYDVVGAYTNESKTKIVTVCSPREMMLIKRFIAHLDPDVFVCVVPVSAVWGVGKGFEDLADENGI